jgi:NADH-quinone oxidoreductase subunit M
MLICSLFLICLFGFFSEKSIHSFKLKKRVGLVCLGIIVILNIFGLYTYVETDTINLNFIQFNADKESFLLSIFYTMTLIVSLTIIPKYSKDLAHAWALFFNLFTALGIYFSDNSATLIFFWILNLVPTVSLLLEHQKTSNVKTGKMFFSYHFLSILLIAIAFILFKNSSLLFENFTNVKIHLKNSTRFKIGSFLLVIAILIRQGIFPFHSWVREKSKNLSLPFYTSFMLVQPGFMLFYKFLRPIIQFEVGVGFPLISAIAIFSSIYLATLGIAEKNLKNIFSAIFLSQTSIILTGFEMGDKLGIYGGLFQWMSLTLSLGSWASILYLINLRLDSSDLKYHQGLVETYPRIARLFFILGFLCVGIPLGMGFIGEDLLVHGIIEHYPWLGLGIIIATCLNGINIYRSYMIIFTGEAPKEKLALDIQNKHYYPFVITIFIILIFGLYPSIILNEKEFNPNFFQEHLVEH